ncbi:unnamed protein product [Soboliphyme baturini]|uniref:Uncharacterized protein n=1 Tax=Soboliphyme baturini TaxID=241478 RepID=A0A183J7H5_9BILA|nr:unnamed protein product [Soboliphyme baturini]
MRQITVACLRVRKITIQRLLVSRCQLNAVELWHTSIALEDQSDDLQNPLKDDPRFQFYRLFSEKEKEALKISYDRFINEPKELAMSVFIK